MHAVVSMMAAFSRCSGILVTAKKRQEFRIKLQKRARRRAEKKIELMEEEKQLKDVSNTEHNISSISKMK